MAIGYGEECLKPAKTIKQLKGRKDRQQQKATKDVRTYVFGRERDICRCCRWRPAESLHELRFRSLGGKRSKRNSIAVCGSGTTGCHGHLQAHRIDYEMDDLGAEDVVIFIPVTKTAAEHLKLAISHRLASPPMRHIEEE